MSYDPNMDRACELEWADHTCHEPPDHDGDHVCGGCGERLSQVAETA